MTHIAMKAANSKRHLFLMVFFSWLVAAFLFLLTEDVGPLTSLYWSMTTMSTVGYGDVSAATAAGKIVTIAFQAWSIFYLVPCAVANIVDSVRIDEHKQTHDEQEWEFAATEKIVDRLGIDLPEQPEDY